MIRFIWFLVFLKKVNLKIYSVFIDVFLPKNRRVILVIKL